MNLTSFLRKNWLHFAVVAFMVIVAMIYFKPQLEGYGLKQHDMEQWKGMAHETDRYRENTGEEPLWTNALFGGMPATQISVIYPGNWTKKLLNAYSRNVPGPMGILILHLIGFYILALFLGIRPFIAALGAIAFSFASYEVIILQAGHMTKATAVALLAPALGAFIYSYRTNKFWGILLSALFMSFELAANHLQVTYYFVYLLLFIGCYFLYEAIKAKQLKPFLITTAGLLGAYVLAFFINYGNIALTAEYAKSTIRGGNDVTITPEGVKAKNQSAGLDKDYITQWSYGKGETMTFLSPNVKGGGSFAITGSQFEQSLENSDFSSAEKDGVKKFPAYWGEQPFTSGPVYLGAVLLLLAFLGVVFLKSKIKWFLLAATILSVLLSWGKNFMGLTDFFIDHVPGYNKFRTVTIILVLVELCVPLLAVLFLEQFVKERELFKAKKKNVLIAVAAFFLVVLAIRLVGLGDHYASKSDQNQLATVDESIRSQIATMDPAIMKSQYNVDVSNQAQVDNFVQQQADPYIKNFDKLKEFRAQIFAESMNRTLLFIFLAGGLVLLFLYTSLPVIGLTLGVLVLAMADLIPVANDYLGSQEQGNKLKYWEEVGITIYPIAANSADEQILANELAEKPALKGIIDKAEREGRAKADELGYTGTAKRNVVDSYRFSALNFASNYRVADMSNLWSSTRASYFHKSIGGYHGAKLRNINNLFEFHLSRMNNKAYDMLNVKYFLQQDENGSESVRPNPTAMGNAWFVRRVEKYKTANDEIRALGNQFDLVNKGKGTLLINGTPQRQAIVFGTEKLTYFIPGKDTLTVSLSNGLTQGMEALFVMDANGATNLIPMSTMDLDTARSFTPLVAVKVTSEFKPTEEVVMLDTEAAKLSSTSFSGEGTIKMTHYAPNKLTYTADVKGKQLAVFSEIYYPSGWKATVDGKEVEICKVNYLLRGVELTNGHHTIEFVYNNSTYLMVNTIARVGSIVLLLLFALGGFLWWKKRTK